MAKNEPQRPSVEAILTDIHNTLTEGLTALLSKLDDIHEVVSQGPYVPKTGADKAAEDKMIVEYEADVKAETPKEEKPALTGINHNDVPKDVSDYIEAHPGCKAVDLIREFHISQNRADAAIKKYGKPAPKKEAKAEEPAKQKITVEMLRAKIAEFAEVFSMNEALAVNEQFGGSRKVSGIPEVKYEFVFAEMDKRLKVRADVKQAVADDVAAGGPASAVESEPEKDTASITKEDIQKAGGAFVKKYGDPAFRELLAKFVGKGKEAKISQVDPAKYAALHEALSNA